MANFSTAIEKALKHEGGYNNTSNDIGGETYRGISRPNHKDWIGWAAVDAAKKANGGKLKNNHIIDSTTLEKQVRQLYKAKFWDKINGDTIKDQAVAETLFDARLNQTGGFYSMLNNALHLSGKKKEFPYIEKVGVDSSNKVNSKNALAAINDTSAQKLFVNFNDERKKYYEQRGSVKGQEKFLEGWTKRLSSFDYYKENPKVAVGVILAIASLVFVSLYVANKMSKNK